MYIFLLHTMVIRKCLWSLCYMVPVEMVKLFTIHMDGQNCQIRRASWQSSHLQASIK